MLREFPDFGHQFPRPFDGFFFEIIAETPVAEHLEKRVVIRIQPDILQIIMLAARADALLGIGGAGRIERALLLAEKNRHKLVHPRVREEQIGRVGQQARRRHNRVLLRFKKLEKRLAYLATGHR